MSEPTLSEVVAYFNGTAGKHTSDRVELAIYEHGNLSDKIFMIKKHLAQSIGKNQDPRYNDLVREMNGMQDVKGRINAHISTIDAAIINCSDPTVMVALLQAKSTALLALAQYTK